MSEEAEVRGALKKVGEETTEVYELDLELDDSAREELEADPRGFIKRFLESQGHKVNGLTLDPQSFVGGGWPRGWSHISSGRDESHWFQKFL